MCFTHYPVSFMVEGEAMVTSDFSLVLEIEMTISFGSQSYKLWFSLILSVHIKEFLSMKAHIYRVLLVHVHIS